MAPPAEPFEFVVEWPLAGVGLTASATAGWPCLTSKDPCSTRASRSTIRRARRSIVVTSVSESLTCRTAAFRLLLTFADAFRVAPLGNAQSAWAKEVEAGGDCRLTPLPWT